MEAAIPVFKSWQGKKVTKRLQTAVNKVAPGLRIKRSDYGNKIEVSHFDYDARMYKTGDGNTGYVRDYVRDVKWCGENNEYDQPFDADAFLEHIYKCIDKNFNYIQQHREFLANGHNIVAKYNETREAFEAARKEIPSNIREVVIGNYEYITEIKLREA